MDRRLLLKTLPVVVAAVQAAPSVAADSAANLTHLKVDRLTGLKAWANQPGLKPAIRQNRGAKGTILLALAAKSAKPLPSDARLGLSFDAAPGFKQGVAFWRYAPWKAWTKPVKMARLDDLEADDVQCAYWQYEDGTYALALPLGGGGFRATLGARDGRLVTVAAALAPAKLREALPQVAIGFGNDLYQVMADVFEDAMVALGTPENLRRKKTLPESLTYLGWNSWNASDMGKNLTADWCIDQVDKMKVAGVPVSTFVIDDGYFEASDSRLQSQAPNKVKFPDGLKPVVDKLKAHGIKHVGVWHAFNIYWNGIDPESELGARYKDKLFTWTQKPSPIDTSGRTVTYASLKPEPALLNAYFNDYYTGLKAAGITLVKVDNQLVAERMAKDNYPVWDIATAYHDAINKNVAKHFNNAIINCMDMTNDAFLNFGTTAVARAVEDYFSYKIGEGYDLQEGNAAAHVLQAVYNALYFSQVAFPDFDMFESTNPNARLHAVARACNNAPIYVTDRAGQHNVELLKSLVDADGVTLRADTPLLPMPDSLFQVQDPKLFTAFSRVGDGALGVLMNLADAPRVSGKIRVSDIPGLAQRDYVTYSHFEEAVFSPKWQEYYHVTQSRFEHEIIRVVPVINGFAVIGLREKLNGLASVRDVTSQEGKLSLTARDQGVLLIVCKTLPKSVMIDGKAGAFTEMKNLNFTIDYKVIAVTLKDGARAYKVEIA